MSKVIHNTTVKFGQAFKALDTPNRIGGYLVAFTEQGRYDLYGDRFTKDTDFNMTGYPIKGMPLLYNHGMDEKIGVVPIGIFDFVTKDEIGIWAEAQLSDRADYEKYLQSRATERGVTLTQQQISEQADIAYTAIRAVISREGIAYSSGALPQSVELEELYDPETNALIDKRITKWCIIEGSATLTPAEPALTKVITTVKALQQILPHDNGLSGSIIDQSIEDNIPMNKALDATMKDEITALIKEVLTQMEMAEQQAETDAIATNLAAEAESMVDDAVKADPALTDEQELAIAKPDAARAFVRSILYRDANINKLVKRITEEAKKLATKRSDAVRNAIGANSTASSKARQGVGTVAPERVREMSDLRYAHLNASDMQAAYLMRKAGTKGLPFRDEELMSEDFYRHLAHKTFDYVKSEPFESIEANVAAKSALPYRLNELDASAITGQGLEWVAVQYGNATWERKRQARFYDKMVEKGLMQFDVTNAGSAVIPVEGNDPIAYAAPEAFSVDATGRPEVTANLSPFQTLNVTVTPREIKIATAYTTVLDESAIINLARQVNYQLGEKFAETRDQLLLNGDTATAASTNVNAIDGSVGTGLFRPYYLVSDGIRKVTRVTATAQSVSLAAANPSRANVIQVLNLLPAALQTRFDELLFLSDIGTYNQLKAIPEYVDPFANANNRLAVFNGGRLSTIDAVDLFPTEFMPLTNTNGMVSITPGNNTRGTLALVYAPYVAVAYSRQMTMETQRDILSGSELYVLSARFAFQHRSTNAYALAYNILV